VEPAFDVDVGRRRDRKHVPPGHDADAGRVPRVERPVAVQVADVVRRVAWGGEAEEPEHAIADDVHVLLRHRGELAPELVEGVAVEAAGARLEAARVDDVRRADG
jgi:hypothetical protein